MDIFHEVRKRLAFSEAELDIYLNTAPFRYKTYKIKKRQGGLREISQPSRDLKVLQRFILDNFLNDRLVCHDAAMAYRENRSIINNVRPHASNPYLLKMDFKDFFPSIKVENFTSLLIDKGIFSSRHDAERLGKVFFKKGEDGGILSIGSPGSPLISNAMLYDFDDFVKNEMLEKNIVYTRYSDDMAFSTYHERGLFEVPKKISNIISDLQYPKLSINQDKTVFSSRKFNRHITGITISNEGKLSIGHSTKRRLRSRIYATSELNEEQRLELRGYLAFAFQVEPELFEKFNQKYPLQMKTLRVGQPRKTGIRGRSDG